MEKRGRQDDATTRIATHRKARREYEVDEDIEAGIVLVGTEVKSLREGKAQLDDAYATIERGEVFLHQLHVGEYKNGGIFNHVPRRPRKLLLHHRQIERLQRKVLEKGYTLIPLELYFLRGRVKVKLGLCHGRKLYDKREQVKERDIRRSKERGED